ncbi:L,D-transpeptidase family protein [Alicyclobacillus suci]|uniref:L,D-transpeptidase family protein n=1 Tax=Alicyclobacillus suci TaxID=2816080 RepID=UPI001A8ECADA|nr:L,D-transpeptidase family protein [Alicyclobacillus suci]
MHPRKKLYMLGTLVFLGVSQTGCGEFGHLSHVVSTSGSLHTITDNGSANHSAVSISKGNNGTDAVTAGATNGTSASASVATNPQYPSLGLGMTGPEVLALNERLAELGYLPVAISAATQPIIALRNLDSPPQVSFQWRYQNVPTELLSQWSATTYTQMTRGAVIAVEYDNHLPIDGIVGKQVWQAILSKDAVKDTRPYTYVLVTENPAPEELRVWQAGQWVYQSIANTGVAGAPSTDGTFAVYERLVSQTMRGTNPDGTKYVDPGVPYINYYNGSEAIHGFQRASYGFPQSVGCVELPVDNAKVVWSLIDYGTLVTVEGQYSPSMQPTTSTTGDNQQTTGQGQQATKPLKTSDTSGSSASGQNRASDSNPTSGKTGTNATSDNSTASNATGTTTGSTSGSTAGTTSSNSSGMPPKRSTGTSNATGNDATSSNGTGIDSNRKGNVT